jgi:hypothetical protein
MPHETRALFTKMLLLLRFGCCSCLDFAVQTCLDMSDCVTDRLMSKEARVSKCSLELQLVTTAVSL